MKHNQSCHVGSTSFHSALGDAQYPVEGDRYWLFASKRCPFAHRTEIVRALGGLERNTRFVRDYRERSAYAERSGEIPAFGATLDMAAAKEGYFLSCNQPTQ